MGPRTEVLSPHLLRNTPHVDPLRIPAGDCDENSRRKLQNVVVNSTAKSHKEQDFGIEYLAIGVECFFDSGTEIESVFHCHG